MGERSVPGLNSAFKTYSLATGFVNIPMTSASENLSAKSLGMVRNAIVGPILQKTIRSPYSNPSADIDHSLWVLQGCEEQPVVKG